MPASPKSAQASGQTMIEAYFMKKVAKPFDWVIKDVGRGSTTYRIEVIGIEDGLLHVGLHRIGLQPNTGRKADPVQLRDVSISLGDRLARDEILDRVAVIADQMALTAPGQHYPSRLLELLDATSLGHLNPYERD